MLWKGYCGALWENSDGCTGEGEHAFCTCDFQSPKNRTSPWHSVGRRNGILHGSTSTEHQTGRPGVDCITQFDATST